MKRAKAYLFISLLALTLIFTTSAIFNQCTALQPEQQTSQETATEAVETAQETATQLTSAINITNVSWNSDLKVIEVTLDEFTNWGEWTMYVDGKEMPMEGGVGKPIVRPNATLENLPTGLFIGTDPWITALTNVDFPICGTLQFDIPGKGLTNEYQFNLSGSGCKTVSTKKCQAAVASQESGTQSTTTTTTSTATTEAGKEGNQATTTTTSTTTQQGISADIAPTDIYPANQPTGVIFARITNNGPGTLSGSKVTVTVSGSKNDISVASTENFITQPKEYFLTLKPGETQIINLEVGIDTSKYNYSFTMAVTPVDFTDPNNGNNSYTEKVSSTQSTQQTSPQGVSADIVITDLYPDNYPAGKLNIRVTNNGPGVIQEKKIAITVSGSQQDPTGSSSKNFIYNAIEFTISLKPGETKVITPTQSNGNEIYIYGISYRYNFTLIIDAVDFIDTNKNNNTYHEAIGSERAVFSVTNNTGADLQWYPQLYCNIYPSGQQNRKVDFLLYAEVKNGSHLIENGKTAYFLIDPGTYDMEILENLYDDPLDIPYVVYSQYGVNITSGYNWVLDKAAVLLKAPTNYPIWGFFYGSYMSNTWFSNCLNEIIPANGYGIAKLPPGVFDWYVSTTNNESYYIGVLNRKFQGFSYIKIPEKSEIDNPLMRKYLP